MLERLPRYWNGPKWQLWALLAGVLSVPLAVLVAAFLSLLLDERVIPLIMLVLIIMILGASLVGSGLIDTLTSQMNRGGLARDSSEHVEETLSQGEREDRIQRNQELRDRRTIRAGLFVIAPMIAFIYLLTIV